MKQILQYAVIFLVLTNLFTYSYYQNKIKKEVGTLETKLNRKSDSIQQLQLENYQLGNFTLANNQAALDYFEDKKTGTFLNYQEIESLLQNKLFELNDLKEGNPLTGYEIINDKKFIIEQFKIINHRWLVANFTDGKLQGELLLKYFINPDKSVDLKRIETVILPIQKQ
jgi:hypothetical protein